MEGLDYWRLCEELSIVQAALLLTDNDPGGACSNVENWVSDRQPIGYRAAKTAISNGLRRGLIKGQLVPVFDTDINGRELGAIEGSIDVAQSRVEVESLRAWLRGRGLRTGFFFPTATDDPDYLDTSNPRYAPKLAAAVRAWQAVIDCGGKSPKQALTKWLREHAAEFELSNDEGIPNETGIEEVAKVANWQRSGGAPKTPGG